ncbi:MAG: hypothetical protein M1814_000161 [Vezdaea aestivalis]|nr:MAG: hypothetical protein M1814_000161 [Vezdaea aestivalis]
MFVLHLLLAILLRSASCADYDTAAEGGRRPDWLTHSQLIRYRLVDLYGGFDIGRRDPGYTENFDPAQADSDGTLGCWGKVPPKLVEVNVEGVRQRFETQQICAKPQYGGLANFHIGGWCYGDEGLKSLRFDPSEDAAPNRTLDSLEVKTFCLQHCTCNAWYSFVQRAQFPKSKEYDIHYVEERRVYQLEGRHTVEDRRRERPLGIGTTVINALAIRNQKQAVDPANAIYSTTQYVSSSGFSNITCPGTDVPRILPRGWTREDFGGTTQGFCASVFNGGDKKANLGGICTREVSLSSLHSLTVSRNGWFPFFVDSLVPSPDFVDENSRGTDPGGYRFWCYARCTCDRDLKLTAPSFATNRVTVHRAANTWEIDLSDGGLEVKQSLWCGGPTISHTYVPKLLQDDCSSSDQICKATYVTPKGNDRVTLPEASSPDSLRRCSSSQDCPGRRKCVASGGGRDVGRSRLVARCEWQSALMSLQMNNIQGQSRGR